ncbi:MAG TPA: YcaO-like family protein [Nitrososphaeraceae archaeon]|nr:YcaO-like family protein [Nitrososphaeraceae archaeon]
MIFRSQKKWTLNGTSRVIPVENTLSHILELSKKIGLTRIADITYMDKLYIPNYSCVLPGTEDYIWVYSGKGPTKKHAKVSAIMESIERYSSLPTNYTRKFITGTFNELKESYNLLHPDDLVEPLTFDFQNDMLMDYVEGYDIINKENILVPAALALFRYTPNSHSLNPFAFHHTNGLASGNVFEEAVCHALCEVIERDAISLAQLRASAIPFHILSKIHHNLRIQGYHINSISKEQFIDDNSLYQDVKICQEDNFQPVTNLIKKFKKFNIRLIIKDITTDIKIPTFNAACVEWISHDYGYLAEGHGTHPDKRIAILRAITEVSQTRAANIQGARDDLRKIHYNDNNTDDKNAWQFMSSQRTINFSDIITYQNEDILDDIKLIIKFFKEVGLNKAIIVNLTNPKIKIPVVRAIVPGLETFKISKSIMGFRARRSYK